MFSFSLTESYETRASSLEVIESYNEATNKLKPELPIIAFASVSVSLLHHILGIVFWRIVLGLKKGERVKVQRRSAVVQNGVHHDAVIANPRDLDRQMKLKFFG